MSSSGNRDNQRFLEIAEEIRTLINFPNDVKLAGFIGISPATFYNCIKTGPISTKSWSKLETAMKKASSPNFHPGGNLPASNFHSGGNLPPPPRERIVNETVDAASAYIENARCQACASVFLAAINRLEAIQKQQQTELAQLKKEMLKLLKQ